MTSCNTVVVRPYVANLYGIHVIIELCALNSNTHMTVLNRLMKTMMAKVTPTLAVDKLVEVGMLIR